MVLMLNFLIALLSTAYAQLDENKAGLHLRNIIEEKPRWAFHSDYNLLTYRVPLLNLATLFSLPCLMMCSKRKTSVIEKIQYFPVYLVALFLSLGVNLISFPFAWIRAIKRAIFQRESKQIVLGVLFFPFLGLLICVFDLVMAAYKLWDASSFQTF